MIFRRDGNGEIWVYIYFDKISQFILYFLTEIINIFRPYYLEKLNFLLRIVPLLKDIIDYEPHFVFLYDFL